MSFIWGTKYRYKILEKAIGERLRELIRQGCQTMGITIVKDSVGKDHVYILVSCPMHLSPSKHSISKELPLKTDSRRVSNPQKKIWGSASMGNRLFSWNNWNGNKETIKQYIYNQEKQDIKEVFKVEENSKIKDFSLQMDF